MIPGKSCDFFLPEFPQTRIRMPGDCSVCGRSVEGKHLMRFRVKCPFSNFSCIWTGPQLQSWMPDVAITGNHTSRDM